MPYQMPQQATHEGELHAAYYAGTHLHSTTLPGHLLHWCITCLFPSHCCTECLHSSRLTLSSLGWAASHHNFPPLRLGMRSRSQEREGNPESPATGAVAADRNPGPTSPLPQKNKIDNMALFCSSLKHTNHTNTNTGFLTYGYWVFYYS